MSPRTWPDRIRDMLSCGKNIQDFTADMDFNQFLLDSRTVRAVAFEFITIGEAARIIPQDIRERYPDIPWGKMQGIRNILVHAYFRLDEEILWQAVQVDIPSLMNALRRIIDSENNFEPD